MYISTKKGYWFLKTEQTKYLLNTPVAMGNKLGKYQTFLSVYVLKYI